jgi:hypothetical protein
MTPKKLEQQIETLEQLLKMHSHEKLPVMRSNPDLKAQVNLEETGSSAKLDLVEPQQVVPRRLRKMIRDRSKYIKKLGTFYDALNPNEYEKYKGPKRRQYVVIPIHNMASGLPYLQTEVEVRVKSRPKLVNLNASNTSIELKYDGKSSEEVTPERNKLPSMRS